MGGMVGRLREEGKWGPFYRQYFDLPFSRGGGVEM